MSEAANAREILKFLSSRGVRLFRNQVGKYRLADGRFISSGLCVGSSDFIGWTPVTITQAMVGRVVAVFTAIEVKASKGRASEKQKHFIQVVKQAGGIAGFAKNTEEAIGLINDRL